MGDAANTLLIPQAQTGANKAPTSQSIASLLKRKKQKKKKKKNKNKGGGAPPKKAYEEEEEEEADDFESGAEEDYSDTQEERKEEYRKGGYHPVSEGELYNRRYRVAHKLGWGYFSTVWLCWDYEDQDYKAIKFQKSAEHYREAAFDEILLLRQIMEGDPEGVKCCAYMTDHFEHKGPNGKHVCMVFRVLGENLLKIIQDYDYKGIPLEVVRSMAKRVLIGLDYLHRELNIIHTDLKPENVLLATPIKRIRDIQDAYTPPPIDRQLQLTEKDPATLSKAQKKRLKKKLAKQRQKEAAGASAPPTDAGDSAADGDDGDEKGDVTPSVQESPVEEGLAAGEAAAAEGEAAKKEGDEAVPKAASGEMDGAAAAKAAAEVANAAAADDEEAEFQRRKMAVLADFGNGCWTTKQFTDDVQTRQYRSPEVILGAGYSTPCDIWSCACMIFELITGEFLFDPRHSDDYDRDEDHLALMMELLGPLPPQMSRGNGKYRSQYLTSQGVLRHISNLKYWGLSAVLHEKYKFSVKKADEIAQFLLPMLNLDPDQRATAQDMLHNFEDWFNPKEDDKWPYTSSGGRDDSADEEDEEEEYSERTDEDEGDEEDQEYAAYVDPMNYQQSKSHSRAKSI